MLERLGSVFARWAARWVPDPLTLALALTVLVLGAGVLHYDGAGSAVGVVAGGWLEGVKDAKLLAFAFQMALILVTGHALALSPVVQVAIAAVARLPRTAAGATVLVTLVACAASIVHWGLGAITGALLAREIGRNAAREGRSVHYPLLGAAAYAGFAVWHGGLSGSAPLMVAAKGHFLSSTIGVIPMSETVFGSLNLIVTGSLVALLVLLFWRMVPRDPARCVPPPESITTTARASSAPAGEGGADGAVAALERSPWVGGLLGGGAFVALAWALATGGVELDLVSVVLGFLFLSFALQGSITAYAQAIAEGARGAGAILLQFPLYFGILGMMKASGLIGAMSDAMISASSAATLSPMAFASAGVVNLLVPSGGGQWVVQGEILMRASVELGVSPSTTLMAFAYGDAWTNLLQPFWALPLLGIMGLKAREIVGYTAVAALAMGALVTGLLFALG